MGRRQDLVQRCLDAGLHPRYRATIGELEELLAGRVQVDEVTMTAEQRAEFLAAVAATPGIGLVTALRQVGVAGTRGQLHAFLDTDQELRGDIEDARADTIRKALVTRAIVGVEEMVVDQQGNEHYRTVYSDRLLEFLARMHLPEAKALMAARLGIEVTGAGGGPVQVQQGIALADVAAVLMRAQALPRAAVAGALEPGEIIDVEDEPADGDGA